MDPWKLFEIKINNKCIIVWYVLCVIVWYCVLWCGIVWHCDWVLGIGYYCLYLYKYTNKMDIIRIYFVFNNYFMQ
jgi:hypothetical protein